MSDTRDERQRVPLTSTQRKTLRGMAHELEPVVHVGRAGLTERVLDAVRSALEDHELIKIKLAAEREERQEMARQIQSACDAELVGLIGTIAILYRQHQEPEKRTIRV
ncbi:MAG TPA: ribosome assembly RNA-binding protein YhbY [Candidatus Limnocylindrales bacterium]|nr:ribosome assembly RNA-binding protein YhbY [Candidatus Limnocylindrales bacterium]